MHGFSVDLFGQIFASDINVPEGTFLQIEQYVIAHPRTIGRAMARWWYLGTRAKLSEKEKVLCRQAYARYQCRG